MKHHLPYALASLSLVAAAAFTACGDASTSQEGSSGLSSNSGQGSPSSSGSGGEDAFPVGVGGNSKGSGGEGGQGGTKTCGATGFSVVVNQPNVLVLFDRSCSMMRLLYQDGPNFGSGPEDPNARWYAAREALNTLTSNNDQKTKFGIMTFPAPYQGCGKAPKVNIEPALNTSKAIYNLLLSAPYQPYSICDGIQQPYETPTLEALSAAKNAKAFADKTKDHYILLITDGAATCGASNSSLANVTKNLLQNGIKTAAVGFGSQFGLKPSSVAMLDSVAKNGGLPRPGGNPSFWQAADANSLQKALNSILNETISCTFGLNGTPPDTDKLYAFVDGNEVGYNDPNGFSYDATTNEVTFTGSTCDLIKTGNVSSINVVYGCPDDTCDPTPEICDGLDNDCDGLVDEGVCAN